MAAMTRYAMGVVGNPRVCLPTSGQTAFMWSGSIAGSGQFSSLAEVLVLQAPQSLNEYPGRCNWSSQDAHALLFKNLTELNKNIGRADIH